MRLTLADLVLEAGLLDEPTLRQARRHARRGGMALCRALVEQRYLAGEALADLLVRRTQVPRLDPHDLALDQLDEDVLRQVPFALAEAHCLLPLGFERSEPAHRRIMRVAMADPLDLDAVEEIELSTGCDLVAAVGTVSEIADAAARAYRGIITKMIPRRPFGAGLETELRTQPIIKLDDPSDAGSLEGLTAVTARLDALIEALTERGILDPDHTLRTATTLASSAPVSGKPRRR